MASLDKYWTSENINLLVERRIERDAHFKQSLSDRLGWMQVVADLKKEGGSKDLNRINVRKQWYVICELYKKSLSPNEVDIRETLSNKPYYEKLKQFFDKSKTYSVKSKCMNQEYRKKMTERLLKIPSYADRWTEERTNALIDSRIARHDMFKGRGHSALAWKAITQDVIDFDGTESETLSVQQVKKKWENLYTKYKAVVQTQNESKWPHLEKMDYFYTEIYKGKDDKDQVCDDNSEDAPPVNTEIESTPAVPADRWPASRTKLFIERRIARASMFGRGLTTGGWQAVINDLIEEGAPSNLTVANVRKKWENLLTRHKIIKDSDATHTQWPYYTLMEKYHSLKKSRKRRKVIYEVLENEELPTESEPCIEPIQNEDMEEIINSSFVEKLEKCRLCQQNKGEYSLVDDTDFCSRIMDYTTINILENIEILPSAICIDCKTTLDKFNEFTILCQNVNKELQSSLEQVVIRTENLEQKKQLQSQNKTISSTDLECSQCPAFFTSSEMLQTHLESHKVKVKYHCEKSKAFECSECPASFTSSDTLETHLKSHKTSVKYHCEICNISFTKQSALFAHIQQHFEMSKVEAVDLNIEDVEIQYIDDENDDLEVVGNLEDCDNIVEADSQIIIAHDVYQCELCSKTFANTKSLKNHFDTHSRIEHHCPREDCNKKFTTLSSLRHHEMRHQGLNSFLCTVCGKGFVTKNTLKMHEKIHSEIKEHVCEICSKGFSVLSNLRTHQKKHHEGLRFYCSQCPKQFLTKASLQRHELVHTGIKEFVCDICSGAFFTLKELKKHKRYHENVRLYNCELCFKSFYEKHHLTIHMRCHTGERPYPCTIPGCNKSFRERQKLLRHEKTQHRFTQPS